MNTKHNSLSYYHLIKEDKLIPYNWKGNINLLNIILVGINDNDDSNLDIHHLLNTLFTSNLSVSNKLAIIKKEYKDILVDDNLRKDVSDMCNLADGIEERAIERVTKEAEKEKIIAVKEATKTATENFIMNMYGAGYAYKQISDVTKLSVDEIKSIIDKKVS